MGSARAIWTRGFFPFRAIPTPASVPPVPPRTQSVDGSVGLLPDLATCRFHVTLPVGHVVELVGPDRAIRL